MLEQEEVKIRLSQLKHQHLLKEAQQSQLIASYLRETKIQHTWRFRLAEWLLGLATRLSPHHRSILQSAQQIHSTMIGRF